ncbi:PREDICTED: eukaryotic translation initiation factor 2 subunit 2-like isoform X2 [Branchiostoma belcheri]|uniref:Eukaryotic translation initiation factor 2 subunit 2 n=1 Tax=Branchiostoma belcheri TaxID=7741 RepID=A0A6P4YXK2_BRABE|nr:PREDICTED: eukaryotic translation initiation factor 2 subunit 2-like isoform X2 [Branchiostoma belcheri]KAI8519972.1 eukaryotic translation initiation factor 2 [Branchiostoma belcheri]
MAEEEAIFDLSLKKKKKKKKVPFDPDAALGEGGTNEQEENEKTEEPVKDKEEDADDEKSEIIDDFASLDLSLKKKKKKKKKTFDLADLDEAMPEKDNKLDSEEKGVSFEDTGAGDVDAPGLDDDLDLDLTKKKKKKKKAIKMMVDEDADDDKEDEDDEAPKIGSMGGPSWLGSERDYTYDELLTRVFDIMREKNPDMVAGEKRRFVMRPPQVVRVGTKKTSFVNFAEICKLLHRQPKHLLAFLLAELGTSGSVDGNNQLIIKGRFQQKQIENVLRRYIKEYVTCHTCRSPETILQKDTRLYFLQCETCHSRCSVASIKSGFQAVTGKRAALRAKAT